MPEGFECFCRSVGRDSARSSVSDGLLVANIVSPEVDAEILVVRGAWVSGDKLGQVEEKIRDRQVRIALPEDIDRIEFYLLGPEDHLYDWHKETRDWTFGQAAVLSLEPEPFEAHLVTHAAGQTELTKSRCQ